MMLVARVVSKKTKPLVDFTACLAAAAPLRSSSSPSSLLVHVQLQQNGNGNGIRRSFSILSSSSSSSSHNQKVLAQSNNLLQQNAFSHSRSFSKHKDNGKEKDKEKDTTTPKPKPNPNPNPNPTADAAADHQDDDDAKSPPPLSEDDHHSSDDEHLSPQDLLKLVSQKDQLLDAKHKEIQDMKDKVLRTFAEMENLMDRSRREADNSKKFAIQNFAINLLDVADNLGRASSVVKQSFAKIDQSKDTAGAVPLLKTLLEGVDMTNKQLGEVFKKFGVEKYDPLDEQFDPHKHNAVFQVPDASKPPGTVAAVLKSGYMLHERIIRPAEVGVTQAVESNEAEQGSEA